MLDDKTFEDFARFIETLEPEAFNVEAEPQDYLEHLSRTKNPVDIREGMNRIQKIVQTGSNSTGDRRNIIMLAQHLASNDHLDDKCAAYLFRLYERGVPLVGLRLAGNRGLTQEQYLFLAESPDEQLRCILAGNASIKDAVLRVLLTEAVETVVLIALSNPRTGMDLRAVAKPEHLNTFMTVKAVEVRKIMAARTEADFRALPAPTGDERLLEAYANNEHAPEFIVSHLMRLGGVAGILARMHFDDEYYFFQHVG